MLKLIGRIHFNSTLFFSSLNGHQIFYHIAREKGLIGIDFKMKHELQNKLGQEHPIVVVNSKIVSFNIEIGSGVVEEVREFSNLVAKVKKKLSKENIRSDELRGLILRDRSLLFSDVNTNERKIA